MPQFNAGDRVKCVRPGLSRMLHLNQEYVIKRSWSDYCEVQGVQLTFYQSRFELIEQPPAVQQNVSTFYTLIYKTRNTSKRCMGFETQEKFNTKKREVLANGGTVFGEKKLKLSNV